MNPAGPSWFKPLCLGCLLLFCGQTPAQGVDPSAGDFRWPQGGSMPTWVVPVLRLVSSTHVEPTTGVVLSDSGLVLVPADFASPGDEIVVLDGGTDIIRNGRKARIEKRYREYGLEVLVVEGLTRQPASLAARMPKSGSEVRLTAFPPAESIAKGEEPLRTPATLVVFEENGRASLSAGTPLPNVTGPLLDGCGDLLAMSVAASPQTMEPSPNTRYRWIDDLAAIFADLGVEPRPSACQSRLPVAAAPEPAPAASPERSPQAEPEKKAAAAGETPAAEEPIAETLPEAADIGIEELPPYEDSGVSADAPAPRTKKRGWPWLAGALALFVLGTATHLVRRSSRRRAAGAGAVPDDAAPDPNDDSIPGPATAFDRLLIIRGKRADGQTVEASCPVSEKAVNVVIGRQGADLTIDSEAVSRLHARLNGSRGALTLCDLGSRNGTSINGVPCLEGEIMFTEPGDTVTLGDVRAVIGFAPLKPEPGQP